MNRSLAFILFASLLLLPAVTRAQETAASPPVAAPVPAQTTSDTFVADAELQASEVTVMKDEYAGTDYVTPNMQNLSKLYWRLGIFNIEDRRMIDNFLIINECDLYKNFYSDDFEWADVRKASQAMLKDQAPSFPAQFKILVPIDLGRYDMKRGGFDIVSNTAFINSRRVQVTGSDTTYTGCDQKADLPGYPSNVVMILNKPFTFDFVKVDEHVAQAFLLRKRYSATPLPKELRNKGFQRPAFARMRVTFVRYQGTADIQSGRKQAIMYGRLDGIDVFEDMKEEMLLTSIDYK